MHQQRWHSGSSANKCAYQGSKLMNFDIDTAAASGEVMMPTLPQALRHTCLGASRKARIVRRKPLCGGVVHTIIPGICRPLSSVFQGKGDSPTAMQAMAIRFHPGTSAPRPRSNVPAMLYQWYEFTFYNCDRLPEASRNAGCRTTSDAEVNPWFAASQCQERHFSVNSGIKFRKIVLFVSVDTDLQDFSIMYMNR